MLTRTDFLSGWRHQLDETPTPFLPQEGIATETTHGESPEWPKCIDELLKIRSDPSALGDTPPNRQAIDAALTWIAYLRKQFPTAPPTCIIPEPGGGLIIDRRDTLADGRESICELTFSNDGRAEMTVYLDGRVESLADIDPNPEL
ncbi:MAG: hypothetical protein ACKOGA_01860 [Planctomycetaceae bacterium]